MIPPKKLLMVLWCCLPVLGLAQESPSPPFQFRAVLHDPANPSAELFFSNNTGKVVPIELRPKDLSAPMITQTVGGSLILYDKAVVDPQKPGASIAATCNVPVGAKRGIAVILPSPIDVKPAYRMIFIDDSAKAFPKGESRILTLLPMEVAIEAGEHKLPIRPGEIARLPPIKKVNEYNMAQTNFYYRKAESWSVITERQLQYTDGVRRIFIVNITPGALQPTVNTIVDTTTPL